ncbi:MAG TPA: NrpR regulatory domain-containing protein [Kiritimatiellia bacterium]|nr:NrpR regulatory domain-containing protein [Kiritimatiellia bacterium]
MRVLAEAGRPMGAAAVAERLAGAGIQPRTVRYHLLRLDREGFTRRVSRRLGREITEAGRVVVREGAVVRRVGVVSSRIEGMAVSMDFSLATGVGTVIANVGLIGKAQLVRALEDMKHVFVRRLGMGGRIAVAREGEVLAGVVVPKGQVALGTVSSATVQGLLLGRGVPMMARLGGVLEVKDGKPVRLVEVIDYAGTSLDPLELFIKAGLTQVRVCARTGSGRIGVSVREIPAAALDRFLAMRAGMDRHSLGGILAVGRPGQAVLDVPVAADRVGVVVAAGLNPLAALHEAGLGVALQPLAGLVDYRVFHSFQGWRERYAG